MFEHFADRLTRVVGERSTPLCVGIDPTYERLPPEFHGGGESVDAATAIERIVEFGRRLLGVVSPLVAVVKINSAYFERYGWRGVRGYEQLVEEARTRGLLIIGDVKRGDVGHSAEEYARACLAGSGPDAVTVNSYLGVDGVAPFVEVARDEGKGLFVLVRTSNSSAGEVQHLVIEGGGRVVECVAERVAEWAGAEGLVGASGLSCVGAVVSTADEAEADRLREIMNRSVFLIPGFGAQGLRAEGLARLFRRDGSGAVVNASRSIIFAHAREPYASRFGSDWEQCVEHACRDAIAEIGRCTPHL